MNSKSKVLVKRFKSEKYSNCLQDGGESIDIWDCFNYKGVGVCNIYKGRINPHTYIESLENYKVPSVDMLIDQNEWWKFQQNMAPAHTTREFKT